MTAEIALLNRRALAFAADSAVTISDGSNDKIYNSAEKIFELSRQHPIGLMLYNNMEFMGIPLDVIARNFRNQHTSDFGSVKDACDTFLEYLLSLKRGDADEDDHLESVLSAEFEEVAREHRRLFPKQLREILRSTPDEKAGDIDIDAESKKFLLVLIGARKAYHDKNRLNGYLNEISLADFKERFASSIERAAKFAFKPYREDTITELAELSFAAVRSNVFSGILTGLIFGGFGRDDIFPSLHYLQIDGVYFGQIKMNEPVNIDIDRKGPRAAIVPFAQREMVERFLYGIDEEMQVQAMRFVQRTAKKILDKVKDDTGIDLASTGISADYYRDSVDNYIESLKQKSHRQTLDMVDFMPKQELAYAAEAFVSLTSMKRKVSAQQETVGGPIDVAVITRNEGFVWIKRKHYFTEELNPGYKVRAFRSLAEKGESDDGTAA